ncbi:NADPH-dependent FMN reductase [Sphingomonas astaxanthinifaciens]|uniref:ACP phosphodiesterase n=1 Tax=Sphingomonas astaxanthinifaciens DSM 22298 TaxID=1123267 RepID=A0ABQ5ZAJ3_9SPHN|nr:NAD(P)H-dependent oxidoreductase [Sphingomonas astaxanthinifaciens]GLR48702.1 ACP phosphodiesterase [Sphingomonas astaxanthinifaciens DSM 22298]
MPRTIAVLRGSPRADSLTKRLARAIELAAGDRLTFRDIEIHDLPLYNPDHEKDSPHPQWDAFRAAVKGCDGILFVSPEWNRSVPGGLKNAIDIGSRPYGQGVFQKKPTAVVTQSTGGTGGFGCNHHLRQSLVHLDGIVLGQPEMYVGNLAPGKFGEDGRPTDDGLAKLIDGFAGTFADWVEKQA